MIMRPSGVRTITRRHLTIGQQPPNSSFVASFSSSSSPSSTVLFDFPGAATKIRLLSGCASIHGSYWVGYSALTFTGTDLLPPLPNEVVEGLSSASGLPAYFDISAPVMSAVGMGLSALFLVMANMNASCVVRRIELVENDRKDAAKRRLAVASHSFFGGVGNKVVLEPWNVVAGGSVASFNESPGLITFLPAGNSRTIFHRVIDTENGELKDRETLLQALEVCKANTSSGLAAPRSKGARKTVKNKQQRMKPAKK